jgi:hypothetical protein
MPTTRNTAGLDVLVAHPDGTWHAQLQVKTSQNRVGFWPISTGYLSWQGPNLFYVFVRYLKTEARFEAFLETSARVAVEAGNAIEQSRQKGNKEWAPWWPLPREPQELQRVRNQWRGFGSTGVPPEEMPGSN